MKSTLLLALLCLCWAGCNRTPEPAPAATPAEVQPSGIATNVPAPPDPSEVALPQASALKADGKLAEARDLLRPLAASTNASEKALVLLGELNTQIALTPAAAPEKITHIIAAGDTLGKLAKKFGVTIEQIKISNGLRNDLIRIGDTLRIYPGKFAIEISKSANTLTVTDDGRFFKRYRVGTGQFNKTPVGTFKIMTRLEKPPWYRPDGRTIPYGDADNILGTHWLGLDIPRYGIHGTWETNSIGKQSSAGCVRLVNDDITELYILLPAGTPVTIHD
jgi:lipoprotein-anchoring transpeptidase ErfK/SrfK